MQSAIAGMDMKNSGITKVNAILDKIRLYGIESLNRQEKNFLDEQSKK